MFEWRNCFLPIDTKNFHASTTNSQETEEDKYLDNFLIYVDKYLDSYMLNTWLFYAVAIIIKKKTYRQSSSLIQSATLYLSTKIVLCKNVQFVQITINSTLLKRIFNHRLDAIFLEDHDPLYLAVWCADCVYDVLEQ